MVVEGCHFAHQPDIWLRRNEEVMPGGHILKNVRKKPPVKYTTLDQSYEANKKMH